MVLCLLSNDDSQYAQFVQLNNGELIAGPTIKLIDDTFNGKPLLLNGEGVAFSNEYFYVIGSHGRPRGIGPKEIDEALRARNAANSQIVRFKMTAQLDPASAVVERTSRLSKIIAAEPALAPFMGQWPENNGVIIEGIAIDGRGETLFAGFRGPILNGSRAAILGVRIDVLFGGSGTAHRLFRLPLGGRGVRDLAIFEGRILILAGPSSSVPGRYAIYSWDGESNDVKLLSELPFDPARKPEGLLPLGKEGPGHLRVLVMFDAEKEGAPTPIKIKLP
ncbi:hypothetical protein V1283_003721 [Bradyrhizobium sp. AZCC 2262]|uniref:DUF3616 domain-containing protein n=1 Tax=Bradyrhizobium sp. AZCC 2262 TaxID=3117022 RepID=UPI002FF00601